MLKVWFLNVGHGDCTVIEHPSGRLSMIDINTSQEYDAESEREFVAEYVAAHRRPGELPNLLAELGQYFEARAAARRELCDPVEFVKEKFPNRSLFRFILTHPDLDHMRGLKRLADEVGFVNFWDTNNTKPTPDFRSDSDEDDWEFYQELRAGQHAVTRLDLTRGSDGYAYGPISATNPDGDGIEILSPTPDLVTACNVAEKSNDLSLVLRLWHGDTSLILPGDAEEDAWGSMLGYYGIHLRCNFLKASHHGRRSGFHIEAVRAMSPEVVVVSVGRKPNTDATASYRNQGAVVKSTRHKGNIELQVHDDGSYNWYVERNPDR
jgi:beta-lactamase superfamily II metal-dependent hydrolase